MELHIEPQFGPKMKALPKDHWRAFVCALLEIGISQPIKAFRAAWPNQDMTDGAMRVRAHQLWHDTRIQEALHEEAERRLKGLVPAALATITTVMENTQSTGAERLKAAQLILDRGGFHGVTEHKSTVTHLGDDQDQMKRIAAMAAALGISAEALLGRRLAERTVIDITPEPVLIEDKWKDVEY